MNIKGGISNEMQSNIKLKNIKGLRIINHYLNSDQVILGNGYKFGLDFLGQQNLELIE